MSMTTGPGVRFQPDKSLYNFRQVLSSQNKVAVLDDRQSHAEEVGFLKAAFPINCW